MTLAFVDEGILLVVGLNSANLLYLIEYYNVPVDISTSGE